MLPESIRAEIEAKGGLAGAPEPQGNGTTIYRAVSGDYVVVDDASGQPRMRGFSPPAMTQQAPSQPAATTPAPAAAPGAGGMNQQQLEELLRQVAPNNDPRRLVFSEGVRKRTKPADAFGAGGEVQTRWVKWVDPGTGRVVEADIEEDGRYTVTKNAIERGEQGPAASSASQSDGTKEDDTRGPQNGPTREVFENGRWVVKPNPLYQPPKPEKPSVTIREDGQGGVVAITAHPDGRVESKPVPGITGKPQTITHEGTVYERGPDGTYKPAAGIPTPGVGRKNVDAFTPDFNDPSKDLGLGAWAATQRAKIGLPPEQGGITQKDYDEAVKEAHGQATTAVTNVTSSNTVQRQAEQDARTERNTLSSQAADDYTRARGAYDATWKYANPDSTARFSTVEHLMNEQERYRKGREGDARPAPPLHPMFTGMAQGAGVNLNPSPSGAPGFAFTPTGTRPILGPPPAALANVPPPTVAANAAAGGPAPMPAAPGPVPQAAAPPPAPPQPMIPPSVVQATTDTTHGLIDNLIRPQPAAPAAPPVSDPIPQYMPYPDPGMGPMPEPVQTYPQPAAPEPVMVDPYQSPSPQFPPMTEREQDQVFNGPIVDPYHPGDVGEYNPVQYRAPVGGPVSAWAGNVLGKPTPPATGQPGMMTDLAQQARSRPVFDPLPAAGRLAQMGVPADAIAQAMAELGLVPNRGGM